MNIKKCTWVRKFCVTAFAVAMAVSLLPTQAGLVKAAGDQEGQEEHNHNYEGGEEECTWNEDEKIYTVSVNCTEEGCENKLEHIYKRGDVKYTYDDRHDNCTATVTCSVDDCDEKLEETAVVYYYDANGLEDYSVQEFHEIAEFKNPLFGDIDEKNDHLTGKIEGYFCYFSLGNLYEYQLTVDEKNSFSDDSKKINFTLKSEEKDPEEAAKTAIDSLAKEKGLTVEKYLDLTLSKKVGNDDATDVTSLSGDMKINMGVSDILPSDSGVTREFTVLRYHDDKAEALTSEAWSDDYGMKYISFYTDGFSAYALAYKDVSNAPAPAPTNNSSNTSNSSSASVASSTSTTSADTAAAAQADATITQADAAQLTSPKTGEGLEPVALFAILLVSCTGLFGGLAIQKRRA